MEKVFLPGFSLYLLNAMKLFRYGFMQGSSGPKLCLHQSTQFVVHRLQATHLPLSCGGSSRFGFEDARAVVLAEFEAAGVENFWLLGAPLFADPTRLEPDTCWKPRFRLY
jgi:hypothetical protein